MRTIMAAKNPEEKSISFSRRYLNWSTTTSTKKKLSFSSESSDDEIINDNDNIEINNKKKKKKKKKKKSHNGWVMRLFGRRRKRRNGYLGTKVVGTLFGHRRGHVHFAFQEDSTKSPALLIELAMPTSALVREMASGLVRIALECQRSTPSALIDEPIWRTYCNGRKCGAASRAECGPDEWKVLRSVGPITMGAGVLPGGNDGDGEIMYMRASFERVVGSNDSEAFYMMNPDASSGGPELSIYLLRV